LRSNLPTELFPSVIQSVTTYGQCSSVVTDWITDDCLSVVTDWITDEKFRIKKKTVRWRGGFLGWFLLTDSKLQLRTVMWPIHRLKCWRNYRGIRNSRSVRWRVNFSVRIADGRIDGLFRRWNRRKKLMYALSLDPLLPYFSFFFLIPTLPICKQPAPPPPQTKISLISAQQVIFLKVLWSQHPCSDLPMNFINFCK